MDSRRTLLHLKKNQDTGNIMNLKMISTDALSVFIFHHHQNIICNNNLRSIQDIMRKNKTAFKKYKKVCDDYPNLAILNKSATPGEVQLTFTHASVGKKSLGGSVAAFALAGSLDLVSSQRPSKSSWRQAPPMEPRFRPCLNPPFTVS